MKILHVVRQFSPAVGGLESYVKSMATRQMKAGYDCTILTLNRAFHSDRGVLPANQVIDGLSVKRVPFIGFQRFFLPLVSPKFFREFDIIHVHNTDVFFDYVALLSLFDKTPVFATTHGGFFHTKNFSLIKQIYFNTITRFSSSRYEKLYAISQNDYNTFEGLNENLAFQPNAVESLGDYITEGEDFLYLGRLARHKGVEQLIKTHAVLKKQYGVAGNLHIVGPEWDVTLAELSDIAVREGIADSVRFHGCMDPSDMGDVLKQCGYFVSASTFEGFGMSMLEAMSVGMIPFVYPNEAFLELIDLAQLGACVRFDAPDIAARDIAAKISSVRPEDRYSARDFAARYSWDALVDQSLKDYKDARE